MSEHKWSTRYGTYTHVRFTRSGKQWYRHDQWSETGTIDRFFAAGNDDFSPLHDRSDGYDPNCSCCWLNISHTQALHAQRVAGSTWPPAPAPAEHTPKCLAIREEIERKRAAYAAEWPNHCGHCDGWGGSEYQYDPSPAGVALGSCFMTDFEPCPECYEKGTCPRCGGEMGEDQDLLDGDTPCRHCGFKEGDEGAPSTDYDCGCWSVNQPDYSDLYDFPYCDLSSLRD